MCVRHAIKQFKTTNKMEQAGITVSNEREVQPMQLSIEQLNGLKTQHEEELQELQKQLEALHGARSRFSTSRSTLLDMSKVQNDKRILVPLSSSLYVPGTVADAGKVIVELGTGYFCEKTSEAAVALIDRKSQLVAKSIESVENVSIQKKKNLDQLTQIMQYKLSLLQEKK